ncbi:UDP binding domain-containing protein [Streptomyces sp. NPDC090798]|uniref:UDP binding domain-containing protein n=1 Tax=Streptomyces sp. NPDC090798 TaxID=3365968 RepID=UPI003824F086
MSVCSRAAGAKQLSLSREAPSTVLASRLLAEGAVLTCWDPMAHPANVQPWNQAERRSTVSAALTGADAAIIVTEWPQLLDTDWAAAQQLMRTAVLLDGRNLLNPHDMAHAGYTCLSVGRATHRPAR